jgi:butyrate kinase
MEKTLIINLGSTSTKMAVCEGEKEILSKSIKYTAEDLAPFHDIWEQAGMRKTDILKALKEAGIATDSLDMIISRGGNCRPIPGGTYFINQAMIDDMKTGRWGTHPTCVGSMISLELGKSLDIPVITMDPPITDEFEKYARYSGIKEIERISSFHVLSQKSTARKICGEVLYKKYEDACLIVCHLGGGISVGAHRLGKVIDANNALDGDGPFSPERAGALPTGDLIRLCFSGKFTEKQVLKKINGQGGFMSYLGTNDGLEVENRMNEGDQKVKEVFDAMIYQIAKEIGAMAAVLNGQVEAIALTGSLARSDYLVEELKKRVSFIARVVTDPGENEMRALREGALRVLRNQETPQTYAREL